MNKAQVGKEGEDLAEEILKKKGFRILARNWKSPRWGELDIIAKDKGVLVFVEVKTRSPGALSKPFEAVSYYKIRSVVRAARNYILTNESEEAPLRLDVVSIILTRPPTFEYFADVYKENS